MFVVLSKKFSNKSLFPFPKCFSSKGPRSLRYASNAVGLNFVGSKSTSRLFLISSIIDSKDKIFYCFVNISFDRVVIVFFYHCRW